MLDEMAAMRAEMAAMRAELEDLRSRVASDRRSGTEEDASACPGTAELVVTSRRRLFALAGGAAVGVAASTVLSARPTAAINGTPLALATTISSSAGNVVSTFLDYSPATGNVNSRHLFVVSDDNLAVTPPADRTSAVSGYASERVNVGVSGISATPGGKGVVGHSASGVGVYAQSDSTWSLQVAGTGRVYISQAVPVGPPVGGPYSTGELIRDGNADFWVCTTGGINSQWKKFAFDAPVVQLPPQLHIIEPTRVYDSRLPGFGDRISDGQSRSISIANGIDILTGAISAPDVVPAGATAIQFTFTIDAAANNGFLAVTPGDAATFKASTINWSPTTPNIASGSLVKLDGGRNVKVFAGGGGSTHFIIDITGYYL